MQDPDGSALEAASTLDSGAWGSNLAGGSDSYVLEQDASFGPMGSIPEAVLSQPVDSGYLGSGEGVRSGDGSSAGGRGFDEGGAAAAAARHRPGSLDDAAAVLEQQQRDGSGGSSAGMAASLSQPRAEYRRTPVGAVHSSSRALPAVPVSPFVQTVAGSGPATAAGAPPDASGASSVQGRSAEQYYQHRHQSSSTAAASSPEGLMGGSSTPHPLMSGGFTSGFDLPDEEATD